jgi:hypothetical protein
MKAILTALILMVTLTACKKTGSPASQTPPPSGASSTDSLRLLSYTYAPGNQVKNAQDTFTLNFNHTVTIDYIQYMNNGCLPDFKFNTTDSGKTVKFYNFLCGGLGGDYTFQYNVTDSAGKKHSDTVTFHCYTRRINFSVPVTSYFITKDNQYCWVLTNSPNQVIQVGITDTTYRKTYPLNFQPVKAVFNYDNGRIYLWAGGVDAHRDSLYVMDPSSGAIVKSICVPRDSDNLEQMPSNLAFGANGYGMLGVVDENYNPSWLVIDSRNNDTLYRHPSLVAGNVSSGLFSFNMCYPSYDGSKVMGLEQYGSCRLVVLDCITHELSELSFPPSPQCYSSYFIANKLKDQLFMVNLQPDAYTEFLVSGGTVIASSTFDAYGGSEADFSYRANQSNYIYYFDNQVFGVVDYTQGNTLSMYGFQYSLDQMAATTDGKYLVTRGTNSLVLFATGLF